MFSNCFGKAKSWALAIVLLAISVEASAQIPVECFVGNKRTTLDIMFFKYFNALNNGGESTTPHWLFFNRNRASIDYRLTTTSHLPLFGFTEAISYNHKKLKGFAPVAVGQVLSWGVFAKAGVQYALIKKNLTLFSWLVSETKRSPKLDYFVLVRYTPKISATIDLFLQAEALNELPTANDQLFGFTQRFRLGLQHKGYQIGFGLDTYQTGRINYSTTFNSGCFIRHQF